MKVLAIETSCDETAIAIVKAQQQHRATPKDFEILSNVVASQVEIHEKYGGIYPTLAKREHHKNLPVVLEKALKEAKNPKLASIAVTVGPGLEPCLWEGVNFAKALGFFWDLPVIPVNHLEGHIIANFLDIDGGATSVTYPAICLIVSGGHTQLVLMKDFGEYKIIGETRDDAAGECFDKTARILGLGYPGGPEIERQAAQKKKKSSDLQTSNFKLRLPRPMINQKNYDFSFSGLKTAVLYKIKNQKSKCKNQKFVQEMAAEIQQAIIDVLVKKTIKAAKDFKAKTIILGGGVAANNELRQQLNYKLSTINHKLTFLVSPKKLCTDNAAMIAATAFFHLDQKQNWKNLKVDANMRL